MHLEKKLQHPAALCFQYNNYTSYKKHAFVLLYDPPQDYCWNMGQSASLTKDFFLNKEQMGT